MFLFDTNIFLCYKFGEGVPTMGVVIASAVVGPFVAAAVGMTVANFFQRWADAGIGAQHRPDFWKVTGEHWAQCVHNPAQLLGK